MTAPRILYAIKCIERERGEPDRVVYWCKNTERAWFDDRKHARLFESSQALDELRLARETYPGRKIWLAEVTLRAKPPRKTIAELAPLIDVNTNALVHAAEDYKASRNLDTQTRLRQAAGAFVTLWREWDEARQ